MILALCVVSILALAEAGVIYGLLNRLLAQAGVRALSPSLPKITTETDEPTVTRRKLFSIFGGV